MDNLVLPLQVFSFYAALLALLFVVLSFRVVTIRRRDRVSLGDQDNPALRRAIRAHGNFAEYTPIALILIGLCVVMGLGVLWGHLICGSLLLGRVMHAYGVGKRGGHMLSRVFGMVLTLTTIIVSALYLCVKTVS